MAIGTHAGPTTSGGTARMAPLGLLVAVLLVVGVLSAMPTAAAAAAPVATASHYEANVDPATLYAQGRAAGQVGTQGLVILDFGRPAVNGSVAGTMDFDGGFASLASIVTATTSYMQGYFASRATKSPFGCGHRNEQQLRDGPAVRQHHLRVQVRAAEFRRMGSSTSRSCRRDPIGGQRPQISIWLHRRRHGHGRGRCRACVRSGLPKYVRPPGGICQSGGGISTVHGRLRLGRTGLLVERPAATDSRRIPAGPRRAGDLLQFRCFFMVLPDLVRQDPRSGSRRLWGI